MAISGASVIRIELNDRGDPAAYDITQATLTMDAAWHDLDLSAFVPADAAWVLLGVRIRDAAVVGRYLYFRKKGNANNIAIEAIRTQIANNFLDGQLLVPCDVNQVIQYLVAAAMSNIDIIVLGWINGA